MMPSESGAPRTNRADQARRERLARILGASQLPVAEGVPAGEALPATLPNSHHDAVPADARAFIRAESEDDDGYDPYSDRPAPKEPLYEANPWG